VGFFTSIRNPGFLPVFPLPGGSIPNSFLGRSSVLGRVGLTSCLPETVLVSVGRFPSSFPSRTSPSCAQQPPKWWFFPLFRSPFPPLTSAAPRPGENSAGHSSLLPSLDSFIIPWHGSLPFTFSPAGVSHLPCMKDKGSASTTHFDADSYCPPRPSIQRRRPWNCHRSPMTMRQKALLDDPLISRMRPVDVLS